MAGSPIRVLVIGAGRMGRIRVEDLAADPRVDEVLVTNRNHAAAESVASEYGARAINWSQILSAPANAYVLATASSVHAELLRQLIPLRRPILCEKPLALTLPDTDELIRLIEEHRTVVQVGFQRRFDPEVAEAKRRITAGEVGTLYAIHAFSHDHQPSSPEFMSQAGDIFADLLVHDFDLIAWLTGARFARVYSSLAVREHEQYRHRADAVPDGDVALVHAQLADGVQVAITGTRHDHVGHDVHLEIFGSRDSIAVGFTPRTPLHPIAKGLTMAADPYRGFIDRFREAFAAETAAFVDTVASGGESLCSAQDARAAFQVALCCSESAAAAAPITVPARP